MINQSKQEIDYTQFIEIASGVYWVGFVDESYELRCNPYLIVDGNEAVLIDGGSRTDFSTVMLKILRTGTPPKNICRLIYQHFDPDLCGSIPHLESIIKSSDLKLISQKLNNHFIHYYSVKSPLLCIEDIDMHFTFSSGRRLEFFRTPYAHAPGSFITYDTQSKVLFTSDLLGSYDYEVEFYSTLSKDCINCSPTERCPYSLKKCPMDGIIKFHQQIMNSSSSLRYALDIIESLDVSIIAPQHASILDTPISREAVIKHLRALYNVGFDFFLENQQ